MAKQADHSKAIFIILVSAGIVGFIVVLKLAASFLIPLTVSCLIAFVFYPLCKKLNRLHIPWVLCIILILLIASVFFYIISNLLITSTRAILSAYPRYETRFTSLYQLFCKTFKIPFDENSSLFANLWNSLNVRTAVQNYAISLSSGLVSFSKTLLVIVLFVVFLLIELRTMKNKIDAAFPMPDTRTRIVKITSNIISEVTHYISIKFIISLITGVLVFLATLVIKMDFPIIWGFIAFVLNFIPNFGSIFSWLITALFALLQFYPNWGYIIYVGIVVIAINMILGNIVEPRWEGSDLGLSPFIILVCLSFWSWMWGFVGMVLAVPLTVIIKIICENIPLLSPIAVLLGNNPSKTTGAQTVS